jgi:hypothetical protein
MKTAFRLILVLAASAPATLRAAGPTTRPSTTQPATSQPAAGQAIARVAQPLGRPVIVVNAKAQRDAQQRNVQNMPDGGTFKLEDLIHFSLVDGRLQSEWVGKLPPAQGQRRIKIEGSDATWLVNYFNNGPTVFYTLSRFDFDGPADGLWMIQFSFQQASHVTNIFAQGGETSEIARLFYIQTPDTVTLNISTMENNRLHPMLNTRSDDLFHLRADHPAEVSRHLLPLLRNLTGQPILRPGAGDVYRTFTTIPADPAVTRRIDVLLPGLSSIDPVERDRATESLRELGAPGVLAALRYDRDLLLPEQGNRLSDFVNVQSPVTVGNPSDFDRDENFLLDCLDDDDRAVRAAAKAALEKLLGRSVAFDPAAPVNVRTQAAEALRQKLARSAAQRRELDLLKSP